LAAAAIPVAPLRVTAPAAVSAATTSPILVGATVPAAVNVVQIRVFALPGAPAPAPATTAARSARVTVIARAAGHAKRLIATVYRRTPVARHYTFRLTERYLIEVRGGRTRTSLGPATTRTVTVTAMVAIKRPH